MKLKVNKGKVFDKKPNPFKSKEEAPKKTNTKTGPSLADRYPDEYKPLFPPQRLLVREYSSRNGSPIRQYIEVKIMRFDDDEGRVMCFLTMYQESEKYTGYMKGKSVHFPIDQFGSILECLQDFEEMCGNLED